MQSGLSGMLFMFLLKYFVHMEHNTLLLTNSGIVSNKKLQWNDPKLPYFGNTKPHIALYGFWSISLEHFVEHNSWNYEQWPLCRTSWGQVLLLNVDSWIMIESNYISIRWLLYSMQILLCCIVITYFYYIMSKIEIYNWQILY